MKATDVATIVERAVVDPIVIVTVIRTEGSTPREVGARMIVTQRLQSGTIGGGQLEYEEVAQARAMLKQSASDLKWVCVKRRVVLGPDAGQCCGGVVEVVHERIGRPEILVIQSLIEDGAVRIGRPLETGRGWKSVNGAGAIALIERHGVLWLEEPVRAQLQPLYLYGAGHVATALAPVLTSLPISIVWVDIDRDRFPPSVPDGIELGVESDPVVVARGAVPGAIHLVMTHSHDLDAAICEALLLRTDTRFIGLIGSRTKRARFVHRFRQSGLVDLDRLVCPIGLAVVAGKSPPVVAISIAAQVVTLLATRNT